MVLGPRIGPHVCRAPAAPRARTPRLAWRPPTPATLRVARVTRATCHPRRPQGQEISLRLRTDDMRGFRKYLKIRETLVHELAHNEVRTV